MREVDRRSKFDRRSFLRSAAATIPAAALVSTTGLGVGDAWAEDATTLAPAVLKTMVKVARDIYPHDFLGDAYYITAVKPWDGKAPNHANIPTPLQNAVARLDQDAQDRHKVSYLNVAWEADRVALLQAIEQTDFFKAMRSDLVVSLYT